MNTTFHFYLGAKVDFSLVPHKTKLFAIIVMQQASDALSKTADSDTVSTYQVSSAVGDRQEAIGF